MKKTSLFLFSILIFTFCSSEADKEEVFFVNSARILNMDSEYLIIIGDTQNYFRGGNEVYIKKVVQWIEQLLIDGYRIRGVFVPGDITYDNLPSEWKRFQETFQNLGYNIPVIYCTGNHDYDFKDVGHTRPLIVDRGSTLIDSYVNYSRPFFVESYQGSLSNSILRISLLGEPYYVLSLEFGPRDEVLLWADKWINKNKDSKFIVMTHAYLYHGDTIYNFQRYGHQQVWSPKAYFQSTDVNDGLDIWNKIVAPNDNVKFVFCGHVNVSGVRITQNDFENKVVQIRFDADLKRNGGDGWIQLLEFSKVKSDLKSDRAVSLSGHVNGVVYNPLYDIINEDYAGNFETYY